MNDQEARRVFDAIETLDRRAESWRSATGPVVERALEAGVTLIREGFNISGMRLKRQWTWKHRQGGECGGFGSQEAAARAALEILDEAADPVCGRAAYKRFVVSRAVDRGVTFTSRRNSYIPYSRRWTWTYGEGCERRSISGFSNKINAAEDAFEKFGPSWNDRPSSI